MEADYLAMVCVLSGLGPAMLIAETRCKLLVRRHRHTAHIVCPDTQYCSVTMHCVHRPCQLSLHLLLTECLPWLRHALSEVGGTVHVYVY